MDDKDLKITALTQRIGELTSEFEERIADLRVALTRQEEALDELREALNTKEEDVVEGEVV